jgi:hypothetical protein
VTPGLRGIGPYKFGVSVAEGRPPAGGADHWPEPLPASAYHKCSNDYVPSCPLFRPPDATLLSSVLGVSVADIF